MSSLPRLTAAFTNASARNWRLLQLRKVHGDTKNIKDGVRSYLAQRYPEAFNTTTLQINNETTSDANKEVILSGRRKALDTLIRLNGYKTVPLPNADSFVPLAEGVIAYPTGKSRRSSTKLTYTLYSRPTFEDTSLPTFIEEDLPPYRLIETMVERDLLRLDNYCRDVFDRRVQQPIQRVGRIFQRSKPELSEADELVDLDGNHENDAHVGSPEDLVIVDSDGGITNLSNMNPKLRLLSMPYTLSLKRSSTVVYTSLVVFGALPLAYRSFNYALDYPTLSRLMTVSVVGSITYGIWSSRTGAKTRQQSRVQLALNARIQARNDAALVVLQEKAVQAVTAAVVTEFQHYSRQTPIKHTRTVTKLADLDPAEVGCELRLLKKVADERQYVVLQEDIV